MISGSFHPMSQEWRYYSREKSLIHTLHIAQLPQDRAGDPVFILPVPPTGTAGNNFGVPPLTLPVITPYVGVNVTKVTNNFPPLWMGLGTNALTFDSGTYGNWSGQFFFNLVTPPLATDKGEYFRPPTGGCYLYLAWSQSDTNGSIGQATLSRAYPLALGPGDATPPQDYADPFYQWNQMGFLTGTGWNNTFTGNKSLAGFGNAAGMMIGTIVDSVPYGTWLGERQVTDHSVNVWPEISHLFRLGP